LTPEQFELVCAENREAVLELAADGHVIAMTPTGSETSGRKWTQQSVGDAVAALGGLND